MKDLIQNAVNAYYGIDSEVRESNYNDELNSIRESLPKSLNYDEGVEMLSVLSGDFYIHPFDHSITFDESETSLSEFMLINAIIMAVVS
jgi:hypothetical protein